MPDEKPRETPNGKQAPDDSKDAPGRERLVELRRTLATRLDLEELRTLCFDLGVDYDDLRGEGKMAKARELVDLLSRRDRILELEEALGEIGELPVAAADLFTVPFIRNPDFVGRAEDLERLHRALQGAEPARDEPADPAAGEPSEPQDGPRSIVGIRPAGLTGMAGIGKTQLAVEYAYRYADDYPDGVFWINAAEPLVEGFARLGARLRPGAAGRPAPQQVRAAACYLRGHPGALLVLDNVADPASLNQVVSAGLVPAALPCRILFTTRRRDLGRFTAVEVKVLPKDMALQLLLHHPARREILDPGHEEHEEARRICAVLGYLPLALEVAGTHLGRRPEMPLSAYRRDLLARGVLGVLDDPRGRVRAEDLATRHDAAVAATLAGQWEDLENDDARLVLRVAGQLPGASIVPVARLGLLAGMDDPGEEAGFFGSPLELALRELEDASLVEELREGQVRLHPLVREFAAGRTATGEVAAFRGWCAANLAGRYGDFAALEEHAARRGVGGIEGDLVAALGFLSQEDHALASDLQSLLRLFQREAHNLRGWDREARPAFFAQQVHNRAVDMGLGRVTAGAASRLAELGRPHLVLRWQAKRESPALVRTLVGHTGAVSAVAVTPDGRQAVSGSWDNTLKVWDLRTGQEVRTLTGHEGEVRAVAVTPDGRHAVSGSRDRTLKVWDLQTGQEVRTLVGHIGAVSAVAVTPDGRHAISGSDDRTLKIWDLQTGQRVYTLAGYAGHWGRVHAVAVTPDGRHAVSGSRDRTLKVWDLQTGQETRVLTGHWGWVNAVAVTPDGRHAISGSGLDFDDHTLRVWDLQTGQGVRTLVEHEEAVQAVAVTPDGRTAISGSRDYTLKVWDLSALLDAGLQAGQDVREAMHTLTGHEGTVNAVAVTPDGRTAISGSDDYTLKVWDLSTVLDAGLQMGQDVSEATRTLAEHEEGMLAVAVTPDGRHVVSGSWDRTLKVWDLQAGQEVRTLAGHEGAVNAVVVTPDGRHAVSGSWDNTLKVWDLQTRQEVRTLAGHEGVVNAVVVTPDGRHAVSGSWDRTLKVWDLQTGQETRTLAGHEGWVRAVAVTPDGQHAVSGSHDSTLKVWDLQTGQDVSEATRTLAGHEGEVTAVAVTPDGQTAISASYDRTLKVWDLQTGRGVATVALKGGPQCIALAPDGATILAGDAAGNVYCLRYVAGRPG